VSYPGDELYFETSPRCERCGDYDCVSGNAIFCDRCVALEEAEAAVVEQMDRYIAGELPEIPVLEPITVRPVELNAALWQEWKRIAEKL
jgi:hypothetical protein